MNARYYVTLTDYGASLIAQAHNSSQIKLLNMVIGDANNQPYEPVDQKHRTHLINQTASIPIQSIEIIDTSAIVTAVIEANIGGFYFHEYGFTDKTGQLVYIANYHGAYKPIIQEGAGGELKLVTEIKADSGAQVLIEVDPNVVTANKDWVLKQLERFKIAIGDPFITFQKFKDAQAVAEYKGYGQWKAIGDGHALVALASESNQLAPDWMKQLGVTGGEFTHKLTTDELPKFRLKNGFVDDHQGSSSSHVYGYTQEDLPGLAVGRAETSGGTSDGWQGYTSYIGQDKEHNIVQPSLIVAIWLRIE